MNLRIRHHNPASMLKESLDEILYAAKWAIQFRKDKNWNVPHVQGGCLGYPATMLLFTIVDSIGSYFRKDEIFKVIIDSKPYIIDSDGEKHFYILNSKYFNQTLSLEHIKALYSFARGPLVHNALIGRDVLLWPTYPGKAAFPNFINEGKGKYSISLTDFFQICETAIELFKGDIDTVVPKSKQGKQFIGS